MQLTKKQKYIIFGGGFIGILLIWGAIYLWGTFWSFSESYTEGYIQNFGHKGNLITTWECEVAKRGPAQGNQPVWECSVKDSDLVKQIQQIHSDQLVRIYYEKFWHVGSFSGKTQYIVKRVEPINQINPEIENILRQHTGSIDPQDLREFLKAQREKYPAKK